MPQFFKHDQERFDAYLTSVEDKKGTISGATLMPHELVGQISHLHWTHSLLDQNKRLNPIKEFKKKVAQTRMRVVELQWKILIDSLRDSGSIENSIAICDVSGSMGSFGLPSKWYIQPTLPAVSLSLILANLAKLSCNGGFITFSAEPQFHRLDFTRSLREQVDNMASAEWGCNTDLRAVFLDLLLPLTIKNNIKQEDMIKRLFVFSDMQFDTSQDLEATPTQWAPNYDIIQKAYKQAGYEVPEIVYWDLSQSQYRLRTVEVESDRKGVAMMDGCSLAMLKVFMGEAQEQETLVSEENNNTNKKEKVEEFNPVNVRRRRSCGPALMDWLSSIKRVRDFDCWFRCHYLPFCLHHLSTSHGFYPYPLNP